MAKNIYQLKVTLNQITPPIWRRIEINPNITLEDLHYIIQAIMPWYDAHLYQFIVGNEYYTMQMEDEWEKPSGYTHKVKVSRLLKTEKDKIIYEYDFGDGWQHTILLEKILVAEKGVSYPRCTKGKRKCPPEDCGGPWGYAELLEALNDPKHPEHKDMREWLGMRRGEEWDAEYFDLEETNQELEHLRK